MSVLSDASLGLSEPTDAPFPSPPPRRPSVQQESGHDDDFNDVAAMGGVNLQEESQNILGATGNVGTQIRSVRDETFLPSAALQLKIRQIGECSSGDGQPMRCSAAGLRSN